jgi:hypothetical protein
MNPLIAIAAQVFPSIIVLWPVTREVLLRRRLLRP